jgi:hypothetical protein
VSDNPEPDASPNADAPWQRNCAPAAVITTIESTDPYYGNDCVHGGWDLQSLNGTTVPASGRVAVAVPPSPITLGSNPFDPSSTFAIHVTGSGQQNMPSEFAYAQLTAHLNTISDTEIGTVDARAYTGIQFYAIVNTGPTGARLTVGNLYTDPAGGMCTIASGPTGCYDNPGAQLTVSTTWQKYTIRFADLVQLGFGNPSPVGAAFPKQAITHLKWDIGIPDTGPTAAWELWIDDLTFF